MKEQLITQLLQFILGAVGIISAYVLAKFAGFLQVNKDKVVAEKGASNYNWALSLAKGLYSVLESEFSSVEKAGAQKKVEMDARLLKVIPQLTQEELDSINKNVCDGVKKVVDVVTTPAEEVKVSPVEVKADVQVQSIGTPTNSTGAQDATATEVKAQ